MSESHEEPISCLRCASAMIKGHLRGPTDIIVHVESTRSLEGSPLLALICQSCGYVELRTTDLEKLLERDISAETLESFTPDE